MSRVSTRRKVTAHQASLVASVGDELQLRKVTLKFGDWGRELGHLLYAAQASQPSTEERSAGLRRIGKIEEAFEQEVFEFEKSFARRPTADNGQARIDRARVAIDEIRDLLVRVRVGLT